MQLAFSGAGEGYSATQPQGQWLCFGGAFGYEGGYGSSLCYNHFETAVDLTAASGLADGPRIGGLAGFLRATLYRGFSNFTRLDVAGAQETAGYCIGNAYGRLNDPVYYAASDYTDPHSANKERASRNWRVNDQATYCYTLVNGRQLVADETGALLYAANRPVYYTDTCSRDIYCIVPQAVQAGVAATPFSFETLRRVNGQQGSLWPLDPESNITAGVNGLYRYTDGDAQDGVTITGSTDNDTIVASAAAASAAVYATLQDDATRYAIWFRLPVEVTAPPACSVTFESNGGSPVAGQSIPWGGKVAEPDDPVKAGFSFAGWFADEALQSPWDFDDATVSGDVTLFAKWTPIPVTEPEDPDTPDIPVTGVIGSAAGMLAAAAAVLLLLGQRRVRR